MRITTDHLCFSMKFQIFLELQFRTTPENWFKMVLNWTSILPTVLFGGKFFPPHSAGIFEGPFDNMKRFKKETFQTNDYGKNKMMSIDRLESAVLKICQIMVQLQDFGDFFVLQKVL